MSNDRDDDNERPDENNPFGNMFSMFFGSDGKGMAGLPGGGAMPIDPSMLGGLLSNLQNMMGGGASGADTVARAAAGQIPTPDPAIGSEQEKTVAETFRLAELWLGQVVAIPAATAPGLALNRRSWVERTAEGWFDLLEPVQQNMAAALSRSFSEQMPEEMRSAMAGASQMMTGMAAAMFSAQLGQALGGLSGAVLTGTEYGVLVMAGGKPALVEANLPGAAASMGVDLDQLRLYLATVELAHVWLFESSPFLAGHIRTVLAKYASNVEINMNGLEDMVGNLDPSNIMEASEKIQKNLFKPEQNPDQNEALASLDVLLSTIAGWADVVAYEACKDLPARDEIRAKLRERVTLSSDADQAFEDLLGLRLAPTRLRDAATLFGYLGSSESADARDAVFSHPDNLPTAADLQDPLGYRERRESQWTSDVDFDAAWAQLLDEETGGNTDDGPTDDSDDGSTGGTPHGA